MMGNIVKNTGKAAALCAVLTLAAIFTGCGGSNDPNNQEPKIYEIFIHFDSNGTITASPERAPAGTRIDLTIKADPGYGLSRTSLKVVCIKGDLTLTGSGDSRSFIMPDDNVSVSGEFRPVLNITVNPAEHGRISVDSVYGSDYAAYNTPVTLTVSPDSGYFLKSISATANGSPVTLGGSGNTRTFQMPYNDIIITAEFAAFPQTSWSIQFTGIADEVIDLTTNHDNYLSISGDPVQSLTVTINGTYTNYRWYLDGQQVSATNSYTVFSNQFTKTGLYTLTAVVTQGTVSWSKTLTFRVVF